MVDKLVESTIKFSLCIQIITTLIALDGFNIQLSPNDSILQGILGIETFVQLVEGFFYIWIMFAMNDIHKMTPRRYMDWSITTPIMLISTIIYFKYNQYKEQHIVKPFTLYEFYEEHTENIHTIFIFNGLMLVCGFLGETGIIDKRIGIPLGFFFFYKTFHLIYHEYAKYTDNSIQLFNILTVLWGLYGLAAMFPVVEKNIAYNLLDIVSKNFYGLYIYYKIKELQLK